MCPYLEVGLHQVLGYGLKAVLTKKRLEFFECLNETCVNKLSDFNSLP